MRSARLAFALSLGALIGMSCQLTFNNDLVYACTTTSDCGGSDYGCVSGACCRATGRELCGDGRDNDCDGRVDGERTTESCNGFDDDCDGETDEDFDLQRDPGNCGLCGWVCDPLTQFCNAGLCEMRPEVNCHDGTDEDEDGAIDCADSDCAYQSCGEGCVCQDAVRRETACADQLDNDGNTEMDCADLSCAGQRCAANSTQTCSRGECLCNGRALEVEGGALCGDGRDNDCDELTDCLEAGCAGLSCSPDGGAACLCVGIRKAEQSCDNLADDDGEGLIDCADWFDCPERSACTAVLGSATRGGKCSSLGLCIAEFCFDGADNDGDALEDCADPDCFGASCQANGALGCVCVATVKVEADCGDRADNDGDGLVDCKDVVNCPAGSPCTRNNGQRGLCQASNNACN